MQDISLARVQTWHLNQLKVWLQAAHVRRWFPNEADVIDWATSVPKNGRHRLIVHGTDAIGYLRWTYVPRGILDVLGFDDLPAESADIDLFLGETRYLGHGYGQRALELTLAELKKERIASLATLTTSIANEAAHRAFSRAGFRIDRSYEPAGFGPCHLMIQVL